MGKDGISNDLVLLSDIDEIPRSRVLRGLLEQSAVWRRLEAGEAPCSTTWPACQLPWTISGRVPAASAQGLGRGLMRGLHAALLSIGRYSSMRRRGLRA